MKQQSIHSIQTKDGKIYKISTSLFAHHSPFFRAAIQTSDEDPFILYSIQAQNFDFIYQFLQLHKKQHPRAVGTLQTGVKLNKIMQQADAQLITRIFQLPAAKTKKIIDAAFFLQIQDLIKRLAAGIISGLNKQQTKKMILESKNSKQINERDVSQQIHKKIELTLFKNKQNEQGK